MTYVLQYTSNTSSGWSTKGEYPTREAAEKAQHLTMAQQPKGRFRYRIWESGKPPIHPWFKPRG